VGLGGTSFFALTQNGRGAATYRFEITLPQAEVKIYPKGEMTLKFSEHNDVVYYPRGKGEFLFA